MKLFTLLTVAALTPLSLGGIYVCKSQALTHKDDCVLATDCPGNCKIYNWSRGYCGIGGIGDCYFSRLGAAASRRCTFPSTIALGRTVAPALGRMR